MQPLVTPTRAGLAPSLVESLIRDPASVEYGAGCELLTGLDLLVAEDITADTKSGSVARASYAKLHGTASMTFGRELPWHRALIRPTITLSDGTTSAKFNCGAYFTASPERVSKELPATYDVQAYDIISDLDTGVGDAYSVAAGETYLGAVERIVQARGFTRYLIDQAAGAVTLPAARTWPLSDQTTWLSIVNDLLGAVGYAGIWSDWDGQLRLQQYVSPRDRAPEWVYQTGLFTSMLGERRTITDYWGVPNTWVATRSNLTDQPVSEGDGRYTFVNQSDGLTSIDERGRTIIKVFQVEAADQASLVASARRTIDADMSVATKGRVVTIPNPLHWHFDVGFVDDPELGRPANVLVNSWTLPLNGDSMTQEWSLL